MNQCPFVRYIVKGGFCYCVRAVGHDGTHHVADNYRNVFFDGDWTLKRPYAPSSPVDKKEGE